MIKIGDFSKISQISVRTLRYYDEIDMLKPEFIDPSTGYRYYKAHQLHACHQIKALRSLGMGLNAIKVILEQRENSDIVGQYLGEQEALLIKEREAIEQKLSLLNRMTQQSTKSDPHLEYAVNLKLIPQRNVISLRQQIPSFHHEGDLWQMMMDELRTQKLDFANPPYALARFHDEEYKEADVDVEIQMAIQNEIISTAHVCFKVEPEQQVASVVMQGSYENMPRVSAALVDWMQKGDYVLSDSMFNIYLVSPNEETDPEKWVTEVCFPVKQLPK